MTTAQMQDTVRREVVHGRLTPGDRRIVEAAARVADVPVSSLVARLVVTGARRILADAAREAA